MSNTVGQGGGVTAMHLPQDGVQSFHRSTDEEADFTKLPLPLSISSTSLEHHQGYQILPHPRLHVEKLPPSNLTYVTKHDVNTGTVSLQRRRRHRRQPHRSHIEGSTTSTSIDTDQGLLSTHSEQPEKMSPQGTDGAPSNTKQAAKVEAIAGFGSTMQVTDVEATANLKAKYSSSIATLNAIYSPRSSSSAQSSPSSSGKRPYRVQDWSMAASTQNRPSQPSRSLNSKQLETDYKSWKFIPLRLFDLPLDVTIHDLLAVFGEQGNVKSISLSKDSDGRSKREADLKMEPPAKAFWSSGSFVLRRKGKKTAECRISRGNEPPKFYCPSPVNPKIRYPEIMAPYLMATCPKLTYLLTLRAESLDFGTMLGESKMLILREIHLTKKIGITFQLKMQHREIDVEFLLNIKDWRKSDIGNRSSDVGQFDRTELFRFRIPFTQMSSIRQSPIDNKRFAWLFSLETPPKFFKKIADPVFQQQQDSMNYRENDIWFRQTDVVYNPGSLKRFPVMLKKAFPTLDLGRWTSYRLVFNVDMNDTQVLSQMKHAMKDHNIPVIGRGVDITREAISPVWKYIDRPMHHGTSAKIDLHELVIPLQTDLPFEVRYQLEVCLSQGYLNEFILGPEFVVRLSNMAPGLAMDMLETVASQGKRISNPMALFESRNKSTSTSTVKIPPYCTLVRSATMTPTTIYYHTPAVEMSNRVIRQYSQYADRFLRVRFSDEKPHGRIHSTQGDTSNEVFTRVKRATTNGIKIGDRHYQFLAFGNSQLREHGAYFFAPTGDVTVHSIRDWMGHFKDIKVVAKHASRLGQCFSTSRAVGNVKVKIIEIPEVRNERFVFTDGVGKISEFLACMVAEELGLSNTVHDTPSVFQFRLGGCKGVLAVSPGSDPLNLHIRESQYKFPASHEGLDIVRWSRYASAKLNRQLILILSALGVPDQVFRQKLGTQLLALEQAMVDPKAALDLLQKFVDHNQTTLTLANMILDGFQTCREPFMTSMLRLWRSWSMRYMKEKAQIYVDRGAFLLGCTDETGSLRGHFDRAPQIPRDGTVEEKALHIPQVFVQLSRDPEEPRNLGPKVLLGPMIVARNPSLHPGDIRMVCGVDVARLHHLKDVIVFPQTGDRDIPSMCSGGDLDGDDFIIIQDPDLFPQEWNHEPLDYTAPRPQELDRDVTTDDLTTFFITYMKNDSLGMIANAHTAWADQLDEGVKAEKCIELAKLHSKAVDFCKTGQAAQMTLDLKPRLRPHFMPSPVKGKRQVYRSTKILGQLYDQVDKVDFTPTFTAPFDSRILGAYTLQESILEKARELKKSYDASILRIMAQYEIQTEFEVWSTFVLSHSDLIRDYKFHETIGELSSALKDQYRDLCLKAAEVEALDEIAPFVAAMYTVTAEEMNSALKAQPKQDGSGVRNKSCFVPASAVQMPLMSFPWIFHDVLGKIATRDQEQAMKARQVACQPQDFVARPSRIARRNESTPAAAPLQTSAGIVQAGELFEPFEHSTRPMASVDGVKTGEHNTSTGGEQIGIDRDNEYVDANADEDETVELNSQHNLHHSLAEFDHDISDFDESD